MEHTELESEKNVYDFRNLMNRGYQTFETSIKESKTKTIIPPDFFKQDRKSYIRNFQAVCTSIGRDSEDIRVYLTKELSMDTSIKEDGSLKIDAIVKSVAMIQNILRNYITEFVMCKSCSSCNTDLAKIDRITFLICKSCKSKRAISD
jgi:translation initiation factor 2 subunit 2